MPGLSELDDYYIHESSVKNIDDRVRHIAQKIKEGKKDPYVRAVAARIFKRDRTPARNWDAEVKAIFDFVKGNIRYTLDTYDIDLFQRARRTLQLGIGDCDDLTILSGALLQSVGYPIKIKIVDTKYTSPGSWNHIYLLVGLPPSNPQNWKPFDVASKNQIYGWEVPGSQVKRSRVYSFK